MAKLKRLTEDGIARTRPEYLRWLAQDGVHRDVVETLLEAAAVLCEQIEESTVRICMELRDLDSGPPTSVGRKDA